MEKVDSIDQLGRFTLRDEGKTIAIGKIIRYKPSKSQATAKAATTEGASVTEVTNKLEGTQIDTKSSAKPDMVFDMETGEIKAAPTKAEAIQEGDENEEDDN
mmetsp:Transcript_3049/g.2018  ORF Transcript_3049/g.2018 Transcript_3049/m.2018 type:complete len:102 (+) Transcript_3049:2399-2704(+)